MTSIAADDTVGKQWLALPNILSSDRHEEGELGVIAMRPAFATPAAETFDQVRTSATDNVAVMLRVLGALEAKPASAKLTKA